MIKGFDFNFVEFIISMIVTIILMSGAYYSVIWRIKRLEEISKETNNRVSEIEVKINEELKNLNTGVSDVKSKLIEIATTIKITNDFNNKGTNQ